jgi:hypothetical protein
MRANALSGWRVTETCVPKFELHTIGGKVMGTLKLRTVIGLYVLITSCLRKIVALGSSTRGVIARDTGYTIYGSSLEET